MRAADRREARRHPTQLALAFARTREAFGPVLFGASSGEQFSQNAAALDLLERVGAGALRAASEGRQRDEDVPADGTFPAPAASASTQVTPNTQASGRVHTGHSHPRPVLSQTSSRVRVMNKEAPATSAGASFLSEVAAERRRQGDYSRTSPETQPVTWPLTQISPPS